MAGCTSACGFCGACSEAWQRRPDDLELVFCDRNGCGNVLGIGAVTNPVLGAFCSPACADHAALAFETYMKRRGFMTYQPSLDLEMP